ncbi:MAG: hypothetical protein V7L00_04985 [Nostoc sp.]|uniref:hypothetical protein n=1 Tax=Nostoc sp. TaxID=1180 RepID=UPI002FF95FEE
MAKEKRSGGKGFGKPPKPSDIDDSFEFEELVNGKQILVANAITDPVKGIGDMFRLLTYNDLNDEFSNFRVAIGAAFESSLVNLARRRRLEEGKGLLTLTPKSYRQKWKLADKSDGDMVFNWWTLSELKVAQERSYIFGGTGIIARLAEPLIRHTKDRFPVICHAVPFTEAEEETNYAHLVFTVPLDAEESTEHRKIYILERETTPLTKLIPSNS